MGVTLISFSVSPESQEQILSFRLVCKAENSIRLHLLRFVEIHPGILEVGSILLVLVGVCGIRLLWLATVFKMDKYHSVYTIYLSYPISWCIAIIALCVLFAITYHFEKKRHGNMLPVT